MIAQWHFKIAVGIIPHLPASGHVNSDGSSRDGEFGCSIFGFIDFAFVCDGSPSATRRDRGSQRRYSDNLIAEQFIYLLPRHVAASNVRSAAMPIAENEGTGED